MKRTQVVREAADALHQAEAALETAIAETEAAMQRLAQARSELGLTGTMGHAMVARVGEAVAELREAQGTLVQGHAEAYRVYQSLDLKGADVTATWKWLNTGSLDQDSKAA